MCVTLAWLTLGLVTGILGTIVWIRNVRDWRARSHTKVHTTRSLLFSVGVGLAAASYFVRYPYGANVRIIGFPFPAAAFEKHGTHWLDYSGPLTLPFVCANAWVAFVFPHLVLKLFQSIARNSARKSE